MLQPGGVMMRDCRRCGTALDPDGTCFNCPPTARPGKSRTPGIFRPR